MSNKIRTYLILLFGIWILLATVFIFIDLPLSIFLVDYESSWAKLVTLYGEIPGHIVISISIFLLLRNKVLALNWYYSPLFWCGLFLNSIIFTNILITFFPQNDIKVKDSFLFVGCTVILQMLLLFTIKNKELLSDGKYVLFSKMILILAIINPLVFVQSIKILWGRTRFRDLSGDYTEFTPWIIPQGITGHRSFPSGHSAMGWMILPLLLLIPEAGRARRFFQGLIFGWGIFIAFGRIVIGAHYASDVLFSTGMAFLVYIMISHYFTSKDPQERE